MNSLSFLIYLAGVTGSVGNFLTFLAVMFGILAVVCMVVWLVMHDETNRFSDKLKGDDLVFRRSMRTKAWRWFWGFTGLFVLAGSIASITPTRQTVLLITASEMGEKVLNHPRVNSVVDPGIELLTAWMEKETREIKKQTTSTQTGKP
jgi:hypothetical protein